MMNNIYILKNHQNKTVNITVQLFESFQQISKTSNSSVFLAFSILCVDSVDWLISNVTQMNLTSKLFLI